MDSIISALKQVLINWLTSIAGTVAGVPQIIEGWTSQPKNWGKIITGIATVIIGLSAKDSNVTGGTVKQ